MDLAHALKVALDTGRVRLGLKETLASAKEKRARLVIVTTTCRDERLVHGGQVAGVPIYRYEGTAVELGQACGRPFPISVLAIEDPGASAVLSLETR